MADAWITLQALANKYGKPRDKIYYWIRRLPDTDKKKIVVDRLGGKVCKLYVREKAADELFKDPKFLHFLRPRYRKLHVATRQFGLTMPTATMKELKRLAAEKQYGTVTQLVMRLITDFIEDNK